MTQFSSVDINQIFSNAAAETKKKIAKEQIAKEQMLEAASQLHVLFECLVAGGFTEEQAITLICEVIGQCIK